MTTRQSGFIVVRQEGHIDANHWVCLALPDALKIAGDVVAYWADHYGVQENDIPVDTDLHEDLLFHYDAEDCFRVYVQAQEIRALGDTAVEAGE